MGYAPGSLRSGDSGRRAHKNVLLWLGVVPPAMIFEDLPTVPRSEELIDKAFSRAARAGSAKQGVQAQQSMLQTASNILSDNLENVVAAWPDFETVEPFYSELADAVLRRELPAETDGETGGVDALRAALSELSWASRKTHDLGREYQGKLPGDADGARKFRKQGFARMADVVREVEDDLLLVATAREALRDLPDIGPDEPTIVVAGYPNVGKSSFVNAVTSANNEIAEYPFTTRGINVGHVTPTDRDDDERAGGPADHVRYQVVDTPGLLDRPADERNEIEEQAASAMHHLADAVLVLVDPSITCGYPLDVQLELRDDLESQFDVPVITVCNKADLSRDVEADHYMSVSEGENAAGVLDAAVAAIGYEPELPFEDS
jgi:nucleolar GTP-binding protein